ncbi:hypothetical protein [Streptomyces sp. NPDC002602]|uniref:hypothetical protein n=1 Tax=Streptomyces sp. NPDC002602 TaxID=3364654 RepID=UPI003696D485
MPDSRGLRGHPGPPGSRHAHVNLNALAYAADLLLPVIDLGQEKAFTPAGAHRWLAHLLVAVGWDFATTVAAGVTRGLERQ